MDETSLHFDLWYQGAISCWLFYASWIIYPNTQFNKMQFIHTDMIIWSKWMPNSANSHLHLQIYIQIYYLWYEKYYIQYWLLWINKPPHIAKKGNFSADENFPYIRYLKYDFFCTIVLCDNPPQISSLEILVWQKIFITKYSRWDYTY